MKHSMFFLLLFILMMASCGKPETTHTPTFIPTLLPTIAPTHRPQAVLSQKATLYSGPGNVAYESLENLPAGTTVYPLGTYGDFVKVAVVIPEKGGPAEVTGFVWKNILENLPGDLPVLTSEQVPLVSFFLPSCSPGIYDPSSDTTKFSDMSNIYYGSMKWALDNAVRIQIWSFTTTHDWNQIVLGGFYSQDNGPSLAIMSQGDPGNYVVAIPKGLDDQNDYMIDLGRSSSLPIQIQFNDVQGRSFNVLDENNRLLKTVDLMHTAEGLVLLPDGLFPDEQLAFGVNIHKNTSLTVSGFKLGIQPTGRWVNQPDIIDYINSPGLYKMAESKNLTIGASILFDRMIDRRNCQIMQHDFNLATLSEFTYKPLWLPPPTPIPTFVPIPTFAPTRTPTSNYDWGRMDRAVDFATQHGWRVRGGIAYGEVWSLPDWLLATNYTREKYAEILKQQIDIMMYRFNGKVQEWSLANELTPRVLCTNIDDANRWIPTKDFWFEKIYGSTGNYSHDFNNYVDYLRKVLGEARDRDRFGTLIFNDDSDYPPYNNCTNITIRSMHDAVVALNQPGQPKLVDAIGMQMHLDGNSPPSKEDLIKTMQYLASAGTGVKIYITEMDVNLAHLVNSRPDRNDRWKMEASIYKDVLDACLESGVCSSFSTWEFYDPSSPVVQVQSCCQGCSNQTDGDPLLFDKIFLPKPAYFALQDSLTSAHIIATPNLSNGFSRGANLALNRTVQASSSENFDDTPGSALDGNYTTRWLSSASSDPQWIQMDLGATYNINRIVLNWYDWYCEWYCEKYNNGTYGTHATAYQIQVSNDASNWTTIYSTNQGDGGVDDLNISGIGRYVRMYGTSHADIQYGYSLWEFEAYGSQ